MKFMIFVNNQYLSDKQCGIQSVHVGSEMANHAYRLNNNPHDKAHYQAEIDAYYDWSTNYKTVILLRGGNCSTLETIYDILQTYGITYKLPVVKFHEDETLSFALTGVGMIVPEFSEQEILDDSILNEMLEYLAEFKLL